MIGQGPDDGDDGGAGPEGTEPRWKRFLPILRCPTCHDPVTVRRKGELVGCAKHTYPIRSRVPYLIAEPLLGAVSAPRTSRGNRMRERVWHWVPGPVSGRRQARLLRQFLASLSRDAVVLNVGSGGYDIGATPLNVDLYPHAHVDVLGDIHELPFCDGSADAVVCMGTLEHIERPQHAVAELFRVLKPGSGVVFCTIPFLQGYHEDPIDLQRWTASGVDRLFGAFADRVIRPSHGPGSAFAWVGAEYFATLLSLGIPKLQTVWLFFWRYVFAPFKWTDALTEGWTLEHRVCAGLLIVARKP
jgi:uncharacterized protein YbaR (Trm112 family)